MGRLYALDPAMPVLLRPDGAVQVGWDPRRAVLVRPPDGVSSADLAALLRGLQIPLDLDAVQQLAGSHGLHDPAALDDLLDDLVRAGVVRHRTRRSAARALSIRVHGCGPLSDVLVEALRCSGAGWRTPATPTPSCRRPAWIWWCWPTTWSLTRGWCVTCT